MSAAFFPTTMDAAPPSLAKSEALRTRMERLGVREEDLVETFVRGGGPGGQKINKTSSCVSLFHAPSGIRVKCQAERSLTLNRYRARFLLCERLADRIEGEKSLARQAAEKIRRQKRRRSRRAKARMLAEKHANSVRKALRRAPEAE